MTTQEQVNALQADLLAAEAAFKAAAKNIEDAAVDAGCNVGNLKRLSRSLIIAKGGMSLFHDAATLCSLEVGIQPLSGGQDKD